MRNGRSRKQNGDDREGVIGDTKTLLSHWDIAASVEENFNRGHRDNIFGKASRSRVEDISAIPPTIWELVSWNEAKIYWGELLKGEFEWSSIGKQLRHMGLVK